MWMQHRSLIVLFIFKYEYKVKNKQFQLTIYGNNESIVTQKATQYFKVVF